MIQLTELHKNILLRVLVLVVCYLFIWKAIYVPKKKENAALMTRLTDVKNQINEVEGLVWSEISMGQAIEESQLVEAEYKGRLQHSKEDGVTILSELAEDSGLVVDDMSIYSEEVWTDTKNQEVLIDGQSVQMISVTAKFKGPYKKFARYLQSLRKTAPLYVTINKIDIKKQEKSGKELTIVLGVNFYLIY